MARKAAKPKPVKAKKPRKKRDGSVTSPQPVAVAEASPPKDHNQPKADPNLRPLAISHRDKYAKLKKRLGDVQKDFRAFGKEVKNDGFTMRQIKLMHELSTPEGEEAWRMNIANDLIAAQYQGAAIGQQLHLFLAPDATPAVDIAYDEGVQDCIEGKSRKPGYDPSVPQYRSYMKGYDDEQERRLKTGIKKLEPTEEAPKGPRTDEMAAKRAEAAIGEPAGNA